MKADARYVLWVWAAVSLLAAGASGQVRVTAQVDTSEDIYVGESFTYNIIIDGWNQPGEVDLSPLAGYSPQSAGSQDVSQTSITIINGRTTRKTVKRFVMRYLLTAKSAGRITLPAVTVEVAGKKYRTNPVEVDILKPGTTDRLDIELTLSHRRCYVGQAVTMTVKFFASAELGDFQINVPVFENEEDFDFEDPDEVPAGAKRYRLSAGSQVPVYITQSRVVHKGRQASMLLFRKLLIPKRPGRIEIAAVTVSADVVVGGTRSFFRFSPQYKRFMVGSDSAVLEVLPLPEQGKPEGFYGLVGRYTISATAEPTKVHVGDPITLTIRISGERLKPVRWPRLESVGELAANFKIPSERAAGTVQDGAKVFVQTIRAKTDKVERIPPIPLAYFDSEQGRYVVTATDPIKLEVAATEVLTPGDLQGGDFRPVNREVEALKKGISANYEGLDALESVRFSPVEALLSVSYGALWMVPLAVLAGSVVARLFAFTSPEKKAMRRRRRAAGEAIALLKKVRAGDQAAGEQVAAAMKQYVGQRFGRTAGSLTGDDCRAIVAEATGDREVADRYKQIMERCEAARYAAGQADIDTGKVRDVIELIRLVEKKSRK